MRAEGSLGSRPSPFRARLNFAHAANICIIKRTRNGEGLEPRLD